MKCPECASLSLKSKVYQGYTTVTLMYSQQWWDEDGVYHSHDPNWHGTSYRCSNGHDWSRRYLAVCPAGDYPKE